jgi:hypothetical protein
VRKVGDALIRALTRLGLGGRATRVLSVRGRKTGRPYFDAEADAPLEEFAAEAARHPVFRIVERGRA